MDLTTLVSYRKRKETKKVNQAKMQPRLLAVFPFATRVPEQVACEIPVRFECLYSIMNLQLI